MVEKHTRGLRRNIFLLFWAKALMTMGVINIVIVLFYIHRGVSVSEVFYLSVVWSLAMFVVEIPSSYLADRWGRKKTL
ncbi:MAG: MFS transporter, partial [Candidatus Magasanikbacteria bacterium CG10_big_fil_rev_8_21_14_0_10_38_6]